MTTPFPFVAGAVLTAAQLNAITTLPISAKTASYTLAVGDVGYRVQMTSASATTITVNTGIFAAGDTIWIQNMGAGVCTITSGTCTVTTASSLALAQYGGGTLVFQSASAATFFSQQAATYGTFTGGTALATPPTGYTGAAFTSDGTMTVTRAGIFEVLAIGGGGGGGSNNVGSLSSGGGGGGGVTITTVYLAAGAHTVVVGAGGAQDLNGRSTSIDANVINAVGGGRGGGRTYAFSGGAGGSGGGQFYNNGTFILGYAFTGLGNNGGSPTTNNAGSGGGGYSAAGGAGASVTGGDGGAGYDIATFTGNASTLKAAGGGGGGNTTGGAGGSSVGGAGGSNANGAAAAANTGSGGGGQGGAGASGGAGGSGYIAIRVKS